MAEAPQKSWSDIPLDLAGLVLRRLPAKVDRVRFAAVCPQWRSAARQVPLPPPLPLLVLPDGTTYSLPRSETFRFPGCAGHAKACGNWMLFTGEDGCFLRDPFSNTTLTLPAPCRTRVRCDVSSGHAWRECQQAMDLSERKVIFCSAQLIVAVVRFRNISRLAVCQPGAASWWSVHIDYWSPHFEDVTFHQGKLYAFSYEDGEDGEDGGLLSIDIRIDHNTGDPWVSQIRRVISGSPCSGIWITPNFASLKMVYLVELHGRLLMVQRTAHSQVKMPPQVETVRIVKTGQNDFVVFEADMEGSQWTMVKTIGNNQVLFLHRLCSRSVCVSEYEMQGGCIIFFENDDNHFRWCDKQSSSSCKVYNMRDGKTSTLLPMVSWNPGTVFATWLFPHNN